MSGFASTTGVMAQNGAAERFLTNRWHAEWCAAPMRAPNAAPVFAGHWDYPLFSTRTTAR